MLKIPSNFDDKMLERKLIEIGQVNPRYYIALKRAMKKHAEGILEAVDIGTGLEEFIEGNHGERARRGCVLWAQGASRIVIDEQSIVNKGHKPESAPAKAYAQITNQPLQYKYFSQVIDDFFKDQDAWRLSVPVGPGKWKRATMEDLDNGDLDNYSLYRRIVNQASEKGVLVLGFKYGHHNTSWIDYEITFMRYGGDIVISNLSIPASARDHFTWVGSESRSYNWVNAIWSPVEISPIATMRSSLWHGYDVVAHALHRRHAA